ADRPARETLRSSAEPGTPFRAFSMGVVTVRSISRGVSPEAVVRTDTWIVETSGRASMGSVDTAHPPAARRAKRNTITALRNRIEMWTSRSSMWLSAEELALQRKDAFDDDG